MTKEQQCIYFSEEVLREMQSEARRLRRSLSWVARRAWTRGVGQLRQFRPSASPRAPDDDAP